MLQKRSILILISGIAISTAIFLIDGKTFGWSYFIPRVLIFAAISLFVSRFVFNRIARFFPGAFLSIVVSLATLALCTVLFALIFGTREGWIWFPIQVVENLVFGLPPAMAASVATGLERSIQK